MFKPVDLVRSSCIKRIVNDLLLPRHHLLQRRNRLNSTMATHPRRHIPIIPTRPPQRRRILPLPDRRTLQRKPLHRLPRTTLLQPLPRLRTQPPRPPPGRPAQPLPLPNPPHDGRDPAPPQTARLHRPPPAQALLAPHRREHPGAQLNPPPGSDDLGLPAPLPEPDAGRSRLLDPEG